MLRKSIISVILLVISAAGQWTMRSSISVTPPPPPGSEPWRGILDYSRAADWSHIGVEGGIPAYTFDCGTYPPTGIKAWQANHAYQQGDTISDTRGNKETVTTAGTSGTTEPPITQSVLPGEWPIVNGNSTQDGGVGGVTWQMSNDPPGTDTARINTAVIDCDGKQGVVHLTAGHYYFSAGITFNKAHRFPQSQTSGVLGMAGTVSGVLLKGQGPMQTFLHFSRRGPCTGDICIVATNATFTAFAAGGPQNATNYPGSSAAWLGDGSTFDSYAKGDTELIAGPWLLSSGAAPAIEPDVGDQIFLDQNNDAVSICPVNPPTPPNNCTVAGATMVGNLATIVTTQVHGYHVGQCIGIGDVPTKAYNSGVNGVGYNIGMNPDMTTYCPNLPSDPPSQPSWWPITAVGCIVAGNFVDQASCGSNVLNAFQYHPGFSDLAPNGNGQVTADTGGTWLSSVNGASMILGADAMQSARLCPGGTNSPNPACRPGEISIRSQFEVKTIKAKTPGGQGSCPAAAYMCYTVDPGLYMNNWRASQRPGMWWTGKKNSGDGVEAVSFMIEHDPGDGSLGGIKFQNAWNGWVRNVRAIEVNRTFVSVILAGRITATENYIGGTRGAASTAYVFEDNGAADTLIMNNICHHTSNCMMTSTVMGRLAAYNYMIDSGNMNPPGIFMVMVTMNHLAGFYNLFEGNNSPGIGTDNFHGTGGVSVGYRSRYRGEDWPLRNTNRNVVLSQSFNRGLSFVGSVLGTVGMQNHYLEDQPSTANAAVDKTIYQVGRFRQNTGAYGNDAMAWTSMMKWGNYDTVTRTVRWCGTGNEGAPDCTCGSAGPNTWCRVGEPEIPGGYTFLAANPIPTSHSLPPSFFLSAQPYFWTTTWGTPGWPAIGPDVDATGSPLDTSCPITTDIGTGPGSRTWCDGEGAHHAYQIPAQICYNNLPVDTGLPTFRTFTVTGASHNGVLTGVGAFATLIANNDLIMTGPYNAKFTYTIEVTGINPSGYNGTYQVNSATPTTITYWKEGTPGPYVSGGTVTTPTYKQYDAHMCYPNLPY